MASGCTAPFVTSSHKLVGFVVDSHVISFY